MREVLGKIGSRRSIRQITRGVSVVFLCVLFHAGVADAKGQKFCSSTSKAALRGCGFDANDDYWTSIGKCNNDTDAISCQQEAREELKSKKEECREQYVARNEICSVLGEAPYNPIIDPADFVGVINNSYFPLTPGVTWVYQGGGEIIVTEVTHETKEILGVTCVVVRDRAYAGGFWDGAAKAVVGGELIEDTLDYYVQDVLGNVWYFGEIAKNFENSDLVNLDGSWKAGVDGAKPGIIMKAAPLVGDIYRQEFLLGEAEDLAEVIGLGEMVNAGVFGGPYSDTVKTKDYTPIEPDAIENKIYAAGVGLVKEFDVDDPATPILLIDMFVVP